MKFHTRRLGELVACFLLSCLCISVAFPQVRVALRNAPLGDRVWPHYWKWGDELAEGGVRLVVFGDSWVDDTVQDGEKGKGRSWPGVFCDEINCTSHYNFAASQPSASFPQHPQTGALTSNPHSDFASTSDAIRSLPDLSTQIRRFLSLLPTAPTPTETVFVVSFGFWDIYHLAGLDVEFSQQSVDNAVKELFRELDILYVSYREHILKSLSKSATSNGRNIPFRVVIPKLMDPTLFPGWTERPAPLPPASVAEEQKNAVYLTERWNAVVENVIGEWMNGDGLSRGNENQTGTQSEEAIDDGDELSPVVVKDMFYYDLPMNVLNILIDHQLKVEGMANASDPETPFESVRVSCMQDLEGERNDGFVEVNGKLVCSDPKEYLFWDGFRIGSVANEGIGKAVGEMVNKGISVRRLQDEAIPRGDL